MFDVLLPLSTQDMGIAFGSTDLLLLRGWCEFHGLSMGTDLMHRPDGDACETVIAFAARNGADRWAMWRDDSSVILQPQNGSARRFATVFEALDAVVPPSREALTDIRPTVW